MRTSPLKVNAICAILSVVVLIVFGALAYNYISVASAGKSRLESAVSEAKPYEDELSELRKALAEGDYIPVERSETARFIIGYVISTEDDILYAENQASEYGFEPVLILDCTGDLYGLESLALTAGASGCEIMLTASTFTEETNSTVRSLLFYMSENLIDCSDVFLLRYEYYSEALLEMLISDGFAGYTVYNSDPYSGVTDDGYIMLDYSYLTEDTSSYNRFASSYSNMASIIIAIDMDSIRKGTLTEGFVATLLSILSSYAENDDCEFSGIADVSSTLLSEKESEEEIAVYEEYIAGCEARIAELEEIIASIYSGLD